MDTPTPTEQPTPPPQPLGRGGEIALFTIGLVALVGHHFIAVVGMKVFSLKVFLLGFVFAFSGLVGLCIPGIGDVIEGRVPASPTYRKRAIAGMTVVMVVGGVLSFFVAKWLYGIDIF